MADYYEIDRNYFGDDREMHFLFPLDGDCLNRFDGEVCGEGLQILARVKAPAGKQITVNEIPAEWKGEAYEAKVILSRFRTTLEAVEESGKAVDIAVRYLPESVGKYRISSDDNILFLQDINENKDRYTSIFDNPYLAVYKKAHDLYGACVHINIYYAYGEEEMKDFSAHKKPFTLSMMTDKFKEEWRANASWLKLSFHARKNYPDAPYRHAPGSQVLRDALQVHREIIRFAGEETLSKVTTLHYGAANLQGSRALREAGYRCLVGYFENSPRTGLPRVSYHYPSEFVAYLNHRDFWHDNREDLTLGKVDCVLNDTNDPSVLIAQLEEVAKDPHQSGFIEMLMHEEYFYEDYVNHRSNFEALILEPAKWCFERGYQGSLLSDLVFEK